MTREPKETFPTGMRSKFTIDEIGEALSELSQTGVDVALAFLRGVVFGVLREVPVLPRHFERPRELDVELLLQRLDLFLQLLEDVARHVFLA